MNWRLQFSLFVVAGLATTTVDFFVYNALASHRIGLSRIVANIFSTSAAMAFSYTVNLLLVFHPSTAQPLARPFRFLVCTVVSAYVLQNLVIYVTSQVWLTPARIVQGVCGRVVPALDGALVQRNVVKVFAMSVGLVWNFLWYKFYVYE